MGAAIAAGLFPPTLKSKLEAAGRVDGIGSGCVPWTNAIVPLFAQKRPSDNTLAPTRCGNGHALTPDNLVLAERGTRWRCRQCVPPLGAVGITTRRDPGLRTGRTRPKPAGR